MKTSVCTFTSLTISTTSVHSHLMNDTLQQRREALNEYTDSPDYTPQHVARKKRRSLTLPIAIVTLVAAFAGTAVVLMTPAFYETTAPVHIPGSARLPVETPAPIAISSDVPDLVVPASSPTRLEIPSIGFDSAALGDGGPLVEWTQEMNDANNGTLTPGKPWGSTVVWDSTIAGGGLFGTDAQANGIIAAHTTPWTWKELGAFQFLIDVRVNDSVAITTANGRLCYTVTEEATIIPKGQAGAKYRFHDVALVQPGIAYLITCSRERDAGTGATTQNRVVTLQLNQQLTNTGSC